MITHVCYRIEKGHVSAADFLVGYFRIEGHLWDEHGVDEHRMQWVDNQTKHVE